MRNIGIKTIRLFCVSFIVFLAALHPANAAPGDPVTTLDAELRKVVAASFSPPKDPNDTITEEDMATLTRIEADGPDIRALTGLEYATSLTKLSLLRRIPQTNAELNARPRFNLEPLSGLTELEDLSLQGVVIFDMSPLANLTKLKQLSLLYTYGISEVPDLSKTALVHLRLTRNRITDISGVSGLTNLRELNLASNSGLSDISPLTQLRNLEILQIDGATFTREALAAVLSSFSTEVDQMPIEQYPPVHTTSGVLGFGNTNISDLSVLDALPNVFLWGLYLRFMGTRSSGTILFHLTDLTPLVDLMNKGKVINENSAIYLAWNLGLDYPSLYEDLPALIAKSRKVEYAPPSPSLEREFPKEAAYRGHPRTRYTFTVRPVNEHPNVPASWFSWTPRLMQDGGDNRQFANVPVTFTVTAPDGTKTQSQTLTGSDGLASVSVRLGRPGETHTVEAVVPAKTTSVTELTHPELRVTFTAIADSTVTPPRETGTPDGLTVTFLDYPEENPIDEFSLTIEFSEPVIGFEKEDITLQTKLTSGNREATLTTLTPETPVQPDSPEPDPIQRYTATIALPPQAAGTVRLIVRKDAATTPETATLEKTGPSSNTASDFIDFGPALDEDARFRHPPALVVTQIDFTKGSFSVQNTTQYRFNVEMRIYSEEHKDRWFRISERDLITIEDAETLTFSLTPVETDDASIIHLNSERLLNQNQNQPLKLSAEKFCIKLMRVIPVDIASNMNEDFRVKETRWTAPGVVIFRQYDASWDAKLQGLRRDHLPYYRFPLDGQLADSWDVEASVPAEPPVSAVFVPQLENAQITKPTQRKADVNGDGTVNTADLVLIASNFGKTGQNAADVNSDGVVNVADFVLAAGALDTNAAAPSLFSQSVSTLTVTDVRLWLSQAQHLTLTDATSQRGLLFLEQLLVALTPKETALLPNYPNPFNPETWIPYHLAKDAEVTLDIYNVQGLLVRRLELGHQAAGIYRSRARAAHWDGRNQLGEKVASGLYFYTFTASDFTATQKLLISK